MNEGEDLYVRHFLASRDSAARQKIKLAEFRARYPEGVIFSVEGIDDKQVYLHWIRRSVPNLEYEIHVCDTKDDALKLLDALRRDQTGLAENVYFLLDKDFDGLKGRAPGREVFMTECYSIENYLVSPSVLDDVLRTELHCHGEPRCRGEVIRTFELVYEKFLKVTRDLNFRIFVSRRGGIRQVDRLPNRISDLASVSLLEVSASGAAIEVVVKLEREPSAGEMELHAPDFNELIPQAHYRGKFALMFFQRWLSLLARDRKSEESQLFPNVARNLSPVNNFTLDMMAARATAPPELHSFLQTVATA